MSIIRSLLILLVAGSAWAGQLVVSTANRTIQQAEHSGSTWDTVTIAGTKLTSSTDGLSFGNAAHHWLVLLNTDTLVFGTDSTYRPSIYRGARGINLGSDCHDITIKGGYILHQPANIEAGYNGPFLAQDTMTGYSLCINAGYATYNIIIDSVKEARIRGYNSHVMAGGQKMILVRNSRFFNDCYAYDSRELFRCCCISISGSKSNLSAGEYHYRIENCYLLDNAHAAVFGIGSGETDAGSVVVQLDGDTVQVDSRNKRYTSYDGTGHSNTNAYAIQFTYGGPGSYIKNCVITSGTTYLGGRGIQLIAAVAPSDSIEVTGNKVHVHENCNVEFNNGGGPGNYYVTAFKVRAGCHGVYVANNSFTVVCDATASPSTSGVTYSPKGSALTIQAEFDCGDPFTGPYGQLYENNYCSLLVITPGPQADYSSPIGYDNAAVRFESFQYSNYGITVRNNVFYSEGRFVTDYGEYDCGTRNFPLGVNTYIKSTAKGLGAYTHNVGDYRGADGNSITDGTYGGSAAPSDVGHIFQGDPTASGTQDITMVRTLRIAVRGNNGLPVTGANVTAMDSVEVIAFSAPSRSNGVAIGEARYRYYSRTAQSLDLRRYRITATKSGVPAMKTINIDWNLYEDTIDIALPGDGVWDTTDVPLPVDTIVTVADTSATEGDTLRFWVRLSPVLSEIFTFNYQTENGTATIDDYDYAATTGIDTIAAGDSTALIKVATTQDTKYEPNETITMIISGFSTSAVRRSATDSVGVGTIVNDDAAPQPPAIKKVKVRL